MTKLDSSNLHRITEWSGKFIGGIIPEEFTISVINRVLTSTQFFRLLTGQKTQSGTEDPLLGETKVKLSNFGVTLPLSIRDLLSFKKDIKLAP